MRFNRSLRIVWTTIWFLLAVSAAIAGTKTPACLKPFVENIVEDEVMSTSDRNLFFRTVNKMDVAGQAGTVNALSLENQALAADQVFNIMTAPNNPGFSHLYQDANSMMGAVNDLTTAAADGSVTGPQGLVSELKTLSGNNFASAAGAEFDIKVAQDAGKANVLSFQRRVVAPNGTTRIYDVELTCNGCSLGSLLNENKNWGSLLQVDANGVINDVRVVGPGALASQFQTDILIHGPTNFDSLHFNFRTIVQSQDSLILQQLLAQFDDPVVTQLLAQQGINSANLKGVFQSLWPGLVTYK